MYFKYKCVLPQGTATKIFPPDICVKTCWDPIPRIRLKNIIGIKRGSEFEIRYAIYFVLLSANQMEL